MLIRVNRKVDWIDINAQAQEYATVKTFANGKTPQYNEFRKTKTKYPTRRLMKKFANTADFLDYLSSSYKPPKRIFLYEIAFTNGWKIKEQTHVYFTIFTNSLEE